ncbi:MAG: sodium:solute symporter [Phycisphaerae bacterium]
MPNLSTFDYSIISVYFLFLITLGFILTRKASASLEDYFLGGRRLPWWALGISGMASQLDMTGTMLIVSFLFMLGPRGFYIEFRGGAVLIMAVLLLWTGKWHYRSRCMTAAEWMIYRFGESISGNVARVVTAISVIVWVVASLAYLIKGVGLFLSMFLPFSPMVCALIMISVASIYTMVSGFYGVVYTDLFQSLIILIAVVSVTTMAVVAISDQGGDIGGLAQEVTGSEEWLSSVPHWYTTMPKGEEYQAFRYLALFALFYLVRNVLYGMGLGGDPKYFGAPNERACGTLTFLWVSLISLRWPMMMGFAVLGLFLVNDLFPDQEVLAQAALLIKQHLGEIPSNLWDERVAAIINAPASQPQELISGLHQLLGDDWATRLKLVSPDGAVNPERILPAVLLFKIPAGLRGLLLIALVAASMSTFDSAVNQSAAYFTRDIYQRYWRPRAGNRELLLSTYLYILIVVAGGFAMAYGSASINEIWGWIIMGLGGGMLVPTMLKFYWWRFNAGGVVFGTIFGLTAALLDRLFPQVNAFLQGVFPQEFPAELASFTYLVVIGLIGSILGTYLTKPTDPKVAEHFYRTTRPFGLWGRLKRTLAPDVREAMTREHRRDLLALPFTLGWQITLFLLPMQLVVRNFQAFSYTLVIFLLCLGGMYVFWYRHLSPAEKPTTAPFGGLRS